MLLAVWLVTSRHSHGVCHDDAGTGCFRCVGDCDGDDYNDADVENAAGEATRMPGIAQVE